MPRRQRVPASSKTDQWLKDFDARVAQQDKNWAALDRAVERYERAVLSAGRRSLTAFRQAGEGAFQLTRGLVLLGADGDTELRRLLQTLALVQGGFDVFRGASSILTATISVIESLARVEKARTAVVVADTVATKANTAAKIENAVASTSLTARIAAGSVVLIALAAGVAAVTYALRKWSEGEEKLERILARQAEAINRSTRALAARNKVLDARRSILSLGGDRRANRDSLESERRRLQTAFDNRRGLNELQALGPDARVAALERQKDITERLRSVTERIARDEQRITEEKNRQQQSELRRAEAQQRVVDQAKRELEIAQQRQRSTDASLGRLDEIGQVRLRQLAAKRNRGGSLNNSDLQFVSTLGDRGRRFADDRFAEQGQSQRIFADQIFGATTNQAVQQAQDNLTTQQEALNEITGGQTLEDFQQTIAEKQRSIQREFDVLLDQEAEKVEELTRVGNDFLNAIEELREEISRRQDAAGD